MNHDVSECLFIEVEVVGHKNRHVTLFDRFFLFPPLKCELPQGTIGMHETELGRSQLVVKIQAVALPEHVLQSHCKFIGIGTISSQSFFVYLHHNCKLISI